MACFINTRKWIKIIVPVKGLNWINLGVFHDIHRQCLKYPEDAALLEKGTKTGCGGLPDGETGEQCWSGQTKVGGKK